MRQHRAVAITLIALLQAAAGCHNHVNNVLVLPQQLVTTPKVGDVLIWRLTPQILQAKLTLPDGLCDLTPAGKVVRGDGTESITLDSGTPEVKCKVLDQGDNSGFPINYPYFYDITPDSKKKMEANPSPPAPIIMVRGTCTGCASPALQKDLVATASNPAQIQCNSTTNTPYIVGGNDIDVPLKTLSVNWWNQGKGYWTVTIAGSTPPPCSNGNGGPEVACVVNAAARPAAGAPALSYDYSFLLSNCGDGKTNFGKGKLILEGSAAAAPQ